MKSLFNIKKLFLISLAFIFVFSNLYAMASKEKKAQSVDCVHAAVLNGPSGLWAAYMFENTPAVLDASVSYEVCASPDVLLPKMLKGEIDIGILPPNAAAKVYTKNNGAIVIGAVTGNGMLSVISKDFSVSSPADLAGKKVYVAGQGATPEYLFRYILAKNNVENVELDFSIPSSELAASVIADKALYAVVPEPFPTVASMKSNNQVKRVINLQKEWANCVSDSTYPMTTVVIRKEFAEKYPEVVKAFLSECEKSIKWTMDPQNAASAGELVEKHELGLKAAIASKALPNCAFVYSSAADAKPAVENLLSVFLQFAPESIGGKLPDEGFYFK